MSFSMIQSVGIKNWFPQSTNRLHRFSPLFLSVTRFSDFCDKIKHLTELGKNLLNGYFL